MNLKFNSNISTEEVGCLVCKNHDSDVIESKLKDFEYGVPGIYQLKQCKACKQVFLSPRPTETSLIHCYPPNYHGYQTNAISSLYNMLSFIQMRRRFRVYDKLLSSDAAILDVGCGDGYILKALKRIRPTWKLYGVEFNDEVTEEEGAKEYKLFVGTLEECNFGPGSFDLLIMNHLIEHLPDPVRTLQKAYELLKPGGYIIGEVPNFDSWDRRIARRWWGGHHTPRHLFQFTPKTLSALFKRVGLETVKISPEMHTGHWAGSVQNYLQDGRIPVQLKNGRAWYYPFLLVAFTIPNAVQFLLHQTGIMSFIARKPSA